MKCQDMILLQELGLHDLGGSGRSANGRRLYKWRRSLPHQVIPEQH